MLPPSALRPYLGFAKLSPAALSAIARVVDQDDNFRARVAASVDEGTVGRSGWLWLTRPPGWQDDLAAIEADESERRATGAAERQTARDERSAARRLAATQAALTRAETVGEERRLELDRLQRELDDVRRAGTAAAARLADLETSVTELSEARASAVRNLKEAEARLVRRATELNALKARVRELEAEVPGRETPGVAASAVEAGEEGTAAPAAPGPDLGVVARELNRAAQGASSLAEGLAGVAAALGRPGGEPAAPAVVSEPSGPPVRGAAVRRERRIPVALPGGLLDDSVAAAEHLLRTPGVVLVVDGYNVTMTGWPELAAAEQRRRLVALLADLAARTSTQVELVFDGAEVDTGAITVPAPARQWVRVRFSPPDVEADDVVLDLVAQLPTSQPVIVASSDNRVRQGARRGGANLLYSRQLLDTLGVGTA